MLESLAPPPGHRPLIPRLIEFFDLHREVPVGTMENLRETWQIVPHVRNGVQSLMNWTK